MNAFTKWGDPPADPFFNPLDAVLVEIAINLQLPPGMHRTAIDRYTAVRNYIERLGSPLYGKVACFYPQGSMAIDATISNRGTDDEYDIDIIAELLVEKDLTPSQLLDVLQKALAGYPVAMVRQSRCITLQYADGMHLDVTPSIRHNTPRLRESVIPHAKPQGDEYWVESNSFGFCEWYKDRTPTEEAFAKAFNQRFYDHAGLELKAEADVHEVPAQAPFLIKSVTTVAMQLLKRHRNILYQTQDGRMPPSILLSCHAGRAAKVGMTLSEMVIRQARWTANEIDAAERFGQLLDVRNPIYSRDVLTDRWPANRAQQKFYSTHLRDLANGLESAKTMPLEDLQEWLRGQFGDRVVRRSVLAFNDRLGKTLKSTGQGYTRGGGLYIPAKPGLIAGVSALAAVPARAHTNMGERR